MSNNIFENVQLRVDIKSQTGLTKSQQKIIANAFNGGVFLDASIRFTCRVALDVNEAIAPGIVSSDGELYMPNPKARSQFGKNRKDLPFLTFGLIPPDGKPPVTVTLEGDNVPYKLIETAVKHDTGMNVPMVKVAIDLSRATVSENNSNRKSRDSRDNHDTDKTGKRYPRPTRPHHNRMCAKDLRA